METYIWVFSRKPEISTKEGKGRIDILSRLNAIQLAKESIHLNLHEISNEQTWDSRII